MFIEIFFSNFDPVEEQGPDESANIDPDVAHTLQSHAFLEFTFRYLKIRILIIC